VSRAIFSAPLVTTILIAALTPAAFAQQTSSLRRWEVEVHGGVIAGANPSDGMAGLPPAAEVFTTVTARTSRRVSSWFFGDGAALLNDVNNALNVRTARITPLDPFLTRAATDREVGGRFGVRLGYAFTPKISAELNIDATTATLSFSEAMLTGIEASRSSFRTAWLGLISTGNGVVFVEENVSAATIPSDARARQVFTTGTIKVNLRERGRLLPYVSVGGGVVSSAGVKPTIAMVGNYRFASLNVIGPGRFLVNETDTVTISVANRRGFASELGGGITIWTSNRSGVRADLRAFVAQNTIDLLLDANPQVALQGATGVIASATTPSVQFANLTSSTRSSLSGPPIERFITFAGSGSQIQIAFSAGYFVRF
jgi:hypothetical protein